MAITPVPTGELDIDTAQRALASSAPSNSSGG
jgi:hypothetical protein